ncbi:acyltransferase family protein [Chitinophaga tropicalis]|uniref:Acyltransferase family protein n=1 Tax=Chitinophaga tropicalis TaxID=2683588 RepID=A0A7K1U4E0_9BACT|nr:acyltransferase [Chitinophaga tropicalis]MVT09221.1 acyltransferase family protein [Chitinophaga tropicalis]
METKRKVESLSLLRGLAVLLVCLCHFGLPFAENNALAGMFDSFHEYGKYGVQVFFVISGFVIPLSMDKAGYQIRYYGKFLFKRAARLHPPYLAALVITLLVVALSNKVKHEPFPENPLTIFQSLFYIHAPDNNPVFWTLKIEAEYYLFIGLFFIILQRYTRVTLALSLPLFMLLSQLPVAGYIELFQHMMYFMIGIIGYIIYMKEGSGSSLFEMFCIAAAGIFAFIMDGPAPAIAGLFTVSFILFYKGKGFKPLDFMGEISYSVYLLHFPIGVKFINLLIRHVPPNTAIILFTVTLLLVTGIGVVFWKYVEKPFGDMSNRIKYGESKKVSSGLTMGS